MDRERNLLFGILAVQLKKATPVDLADAAAAWAMDPSRDLCAYLREAEVLNTEECALISALTEEAVRVCGGNAQAALDALGGYGGVHTAFRGTLILAAGEVRTLLNPEQGDDIPRTLILPGAEETPGRYTGADEYARGGMGRVLLVHDEHLGRDVALKELLPEFTAPPGDDSAMRRVGHVMARFLQEARITGQLEHPAVVPVYELGLRPGGNPYYTMKFVRGRTLAKVLRGCTTLKERLRLLPHFSDLCNAVAYAHSRGVIHRDIKPGNVMVGEFGETVVLDWGLAKSIGEEEAEGVPEGNEESLTGLSPDWAKTHHGEILGTPIYMSPEQAAGQWERVDARSDVYSLGAVLYEILTGSAPFHGDSLGEILDRVKTAEIRPVRALERGAPRELVSVCQKALEKRPDDRYPTAKALADEITRFQSGEPVEAHHYSFSESLTRVSVRYETWLRTGAAGLILLLLSSAFYITILNSQNMALEEARGEALSQQSRADSEREEARRQLYASSIWQARVYEEEGDYVSAREALWRAPVEYSGWEWGHLALVLHPEELLLAPPEALRPLLAFEGGLTRACLAPDGRTLIAAGADGLVRAWDLPSGALRHTLGAPREEVRRGALALDRSGTMLALAVGVSSAEVWNWRAGERTHLLEGHTQPILDAAFNPSGDRIATASEDSTARLWDAGSGNCLAVLEGHGAAVRGCAFAPEGGRLATYSLDSTARLWDASTGEAGPVLAGHEGPLTAMVFSPDGTRLATASEDGDVRLWNPVSGECVRRFSGHKDTVWDAAFSPDGQELATASGDGTVRLWDLKQEEEVKIFPEEGAARNGGDRKGMLRVAFGPDGRLLAAATQYGAILLWDRSSGRETQRLLGHEGPVYDLHFSPDGRHLASVSGDGTGRIWEIEAGKHRWTEPLRGASFRGDGVRAILLPRTGRALVWDFETCREVCRLEEPASGIQLETALFNPEGARLAGTSPEGGAWLWDAESGGLLRALAPPDGARWEVTFSRDGTRLGAASQAGTAHVWNVETGDEIFSHTWPADEPGAGEAFLQFDPEAACVLRKTRQEVTLYSIEEDRQTPLLREEAGDITLAAFSPGGRRAVSISRGKTVRIWDTATGRLVREARHLEYADPRQIRGNEEEAAENERLIRVIFDGEGQRMAGLLEDGRIPVWNLGTGQIMRVLEGPPGISDAAFIPDGRGLVTVSEDGTLRIWSALEGREIYALQGQEGPLDRVQFSPDGERILLMAKEGHARWWTAAPWRAGQLPEVSGSAAQGTREETRKAAFFAWKQARYARRMQAE